MKTILIILSVLLAAACNNSPQNKSDYAIQNLGEKQNKRLEQIVNDLKKELHESSPESRSETDETMDPNEYFVKNIDSYTLTEFKYYQFDNKKFNLNPTKGNLQSCRYLKKTHTLSLHATV